MNALTLLPEFAGRCLDLIKAMEELARNTKERQTKTQRQ